MSEAAHLALLVIAAFLGYVIGWMHGRDGK
jgi:hypothetical protein